MVFFAAFVMVLAVFALLWLAIGLGWVVKGTAMGVQRLRRRR